MSAPCPPADIIRRLAPAALSQDAYACRLVQVAGSDYLSTGNTAGAVELYPGDRIATCDGANGRRYCCGDDCIGPAPLVDDTTAGLQP